MTVRDLTRQGDARVHPRPPSGRARLDPDPAAKAALWTPGLDEWIPAGPDDPDAVVVRLAPERMEVWSLADGIMPEPRGLRAAVLFGPERAGLDSDDMARADTLVRYPLNPAHMSLNLAQAVMVLAYEWWTAAEVTPPRELMTNETRVATKAELETFLGRLSAELDACGFLANEAKRPGGTWLSQKEKNTAS